MSLLRLFAFTLATGIAFSSLAVEPSPQVGELDQDIANQNQQELDGTVILRVDTRTNEISSVKISDLQAKSKEEAIRIATQAEYTPHSSDLLRTELDKETGTSSWFWFWNWGWGYNYYPTYYYYGYSYVPYYYYNYGYYNYYWYGYCNYRWW